jgi:hypothetical protein
MRETGEWENGRTKRRGKGSIQRSNLAKPGKFAQISAK